jgi:hypothetical protein
MNTVTLKNGLVALAKDNYVKTYCNRTQAEKAAKKNGMKVYQPPMSRVFLVVAA